jgi:hypothetical protein
VPGFHDLSCVVHLHSTHSDGTGTVAEIARDGQRAGVDVVLLTDHDSLDAARLGEEGWHGDTLLLAGHEVSPPTRNHMLAFGTAEEIDWTGLTPRQIAQAVRDAGGFGIAAHPFSEPSDPFRRVRSLGESMRWDELECLDGIEVWSFVSDNGQNVSGVRDALRFITRPERYVTHPPRRNLQEWDRLAASRRVVGIGGLDAHQFGVRILGKVLRLMSYHRSFRQLRTNVLVREPLDGDLDHDRRLVFEALREGRCYIAAHAVAPGSGFRFHADGVEMGAEAPFAGQELRVELPRPAEVRLLCDGEEVAAADGTGLSHRADGRGVYRVEAYLETYGQRRTWILSNPVYLR